MTLKGPFWLHFDVDFGLFVDPFSRHVHEHVVFAQNAPRLYENAFLEGPGSKNEAIFGSIFASILYSVSEPSPGRLFGLLHVAMFLRRMLL